MTDFAGAPDMTNRHVAIVVSRFNESVTTRLVEGAIDALERHGGTRANIDVVWVPGAWELPAGARALLATERYDAIVALGAVIRGETPHFDFVAGEASRGLAEAGADFDVPVGFGLLTTDTMADWEYAYLTTRIAASEAWGAGPALTARVTPDVTTDAS